MENIEIILDWVFRGLTLIAYILVAVVAIKRKKPISNDVAVGETDEKTELSVWEKLANIATKVIGLVGAAEEDFSTVVKGGALKLKSVLGDTKEMCEDEGVPFDKDYWTGLIKEAVDVMNQKKKGKPAETPTDATKAQ